MTPVIGILPAGKGRDKQANDLRLKTDRRDTLLDATLVDAQLPLVQDFVAQVTAHRATLPA